MNPAPAVFVAVPPYGGPRPHSLPGLPAGIAAALAGGRARVALGGASVAVALLVAATVHLSSRIGGGSDPAARASVPSSPPRYADDFLFRGLVPQARTPKVVPVADAREATPVAPATEEADGIYLVAHRSPNVARAKTRDASKTRARSEKRKSATYSRPTSARAGGTVSTRPGWGWGDKNHAHGGPRQSSAAALGKSSHRRK